MGRPRDTGVAPGLQAQVTLGNKESQMSGESCRQRAKPDARLDLL